MKFTYETAKTVLRGHRMALEDAIERLTEQKRIVEEALKELNTTAYKKRDRLEFSQLIAKVGNDGRAKPKRKP